MDNIEELNAKIELNKELLSVMPTNSKKNIEKYNEKIEELKKEYTEYKDKVYNKMLLKYKKFKSLYKPSDIDIIKKQIDELEGMLTSFNNLQTSYEKMELDSKLYNLEKYYKENLEFINDQIILSIQSFKKVDIELDIDDFNYSSYVKMYMKEFFYQQKKNKGFKNKMAEVFEKIYWKCPQIIIQIKLNFFSIYLKNEKKIDKFYEKDCKEILLKLKTTREELNKIYNKLKKKYYQKKNTDVAKIIQLFLNGTLNPKEYKLDKMISYYEKVFSKEIIDNNKCDDMQANVEKFILSLQEYKYYDQYEYILEDLRKKSDQTQEKNQYSKTYKNIIKSEKKLDKLNKILNNRSKFFNKKKVEKSEIEFNKVFEEIQKLSKDLNNIKLNDKIKELDANSTIYEAMHLALSYNNYLIDIIRSKDLDMDTDAINSVIDDFKEYVTSPYNTIITNIKFLDKKDIKLIIKDKYNLLGFNVTKEDMDIDAVDNVISNLEKIRVYNILKSKNVNIDDLISVCEFEKILNKK